MANDQRNATNAAPVASRAFSMPPVASQVAANNDRAHPCALNVGMALRAHGPQGSLCQGRRPRVPFLVHYTTALLPLQPSIARVVSSE